MTQFEIQGQRLDLPANLNLQLLRKNEIFAFDDVEVERSISFDIPATANNLSILQLANDWHGAGQMMRVKIPATMIIGVVTIAGKICVTQYDASKRTFKAIFVFGELLDLQTLRDAGKFSELGLETELYYASDGAIYAPEATGITWGKVAYNSDDMHGSISVRRLVDMVNTQRSEFPTITLPQGCDGYRIIKGKLNDFDFEDKFKVIINQDAGVQPQETAPYNPINLCEPIAGIFWTENEEEVFTHTTRISGEYTYKYWRVQGYRTMVDIELTFPNDFPNYRFLMKGDTPEDGFIGGYEWTVNQAGQKIITGTPLAGRTIEVNAGDTFFVMNIDRYQYHQEYDERTGKTKLEYGWIQLDYDFNFEYNINIKSRSTRYFLRDNFPDFTPIELCKIIAGLKGLVLRYDKSNGVYFDDLTEWETMPLDDIIQVTTMERKFSDYAQRNYVRMKDEDNPEPLSVVYTITNANLEEEKDLQEIPLASGVMGIRNQLPALGLVGDEDTLSDTMEDRQYLQRVTMQKNATIQGFCDTSTAIQVQSLMNILKYVQIKPNTLFFYDGTLWAWSELQWNDGKLQAKLSKFSGVV